MATQDPAHTDQINFRCQHCGKKLAAPNNAAGRQGRCPKCGQPVQVPPGMAPGSTGDSPALGGGAPSGANEADHVVSHPAEVRDGAQEPWGHLDADLSMSRGMKGLILVLLGAIPRLIGPFITVDRSYYHLMLKIGIFSLLLLVVGGAISLAGAFERRGREAGIIGALIAGSFLGFTILLAMLRSR